MSFDELVTSLARQFAVIWQAPFPFIVCVGVVAFFIWKTLQWRYAATIGRHSEYIAHLEKREPRDAAPVAESVPTLERASAPPTEEARPSERSASVNSEPVVEAPSAERLYVPSGVTVQFMAKLVRDLSGIQAEKLIREYRGKFIRLTGKIASSGVTMGEPYIAILGNPSAGLDERIREQTTAHFPPAQLSELSHLCNGDEITVEGKIEEFNRFGLILSDCTLV